MPRRIGSFVRGKLFDKLIAQLIESKIFFYSNNRIATEGAVYIAKGLISNVTLKVVKVILNPTNGIRFKILIN